MRKGPAAAFSLALLVATAPARADGPLVHITPDRLARGGEPRFRFGAAASLGGAEQPGSGIAVLGVELRAGVQLDDTWAVLGQATVVGGAGIFQILGEPATLIAHTSSVLAELTIEDMLQIALGPSFAYASGTPGRFWTTTTGQPFAGFGPGFSHRVAVTWGGGGIGRRQGFSLGAQVEAAWILATSLARTPYFYAVRLTLGWETF